MISMWTRADIQEVIRNTAEDGTAGKIVQIRVRFLKDISVAATLLNIDDADRIAPYGSKTADSWSWRGDLKTGDSVDAMDRIKSWTLSTVLVAEERENASMPMVKVGLRTYHQEGDKEDSMGKYFGYSEKLDEHIGAYTVRIQKPGTYTHQTDLLTQKNVSSTDSKPKTISNADEQTKKENSVGIDRDQDKSDLAML